MKPRVHIHIGQAGHFLSWELPYYQQRYDLVDEPSHDTHLHCFGPDVLESGATLPAASRSAYLFPGFLGSSLQYDAALRSRFVSAIEASFDLVVVNAGTIAAQLAPLAKVRTVPFSINTEQLRYRCRSVLNSLLHVSADTPHKDWQRSQEVMQLTGLSHMVFPPRDASIRRYWPIGMRLRHAANSALRRSGIGLRVPVKGQRKYVGHKLTIQKYLEYDGFVHVAAPVPPNVDGLYTASLMEAGATGSLLFWHDTHGSGGFLETVFALPKEPPLAAAEIRAIRASVDVPRHSRLTREEILDHFSPAKAMAIRLDLMDTIIDSW